MDRIYFSAGGMKVEGNTLSGIAHVFGKRALQGAQYEKFLPTAFDSALADPNTDVRAFWNHNTDMLLARQGAGTLRLGVDGKVLSFSIDLPETSYAADIKALAARGDLNGASFGIVPDKFSLSRSVDGKQIRTHSSVGQLIDISPVALPAFTGTSLSLFSDEDDEDEPIASQLIRARNRARGN